MEKKEKKLRESLTLCGKKLVEKNLVVAGGGNISARLGEFIFLSPSGFSLDEVPPQNWVKVELSSGKIREGKLEPTCEILMHLTCYRKRPDIGAVIHTHSPYVTGLSISGVKIEPLFPDFVAYLGGEVPLLPYVLPGGEELAHQIEGVIHKYNALTLRNHGQVTVGVHLKEAFFRALVLEEAAHILYIAKLMGKPHIFTPGEVEAVENLSAEIYRRKLLKEMEK